MAITNAQQYKQLLAKGGRIGYLKVELMRLLLVLITSYDKGSNPRGPDAPRSVDYFAKW